MDNDEEQYRLFPPEPPLATNNILCTRTYAVYLAGLSLLLVAVGYASFQCFAPGGLTPQSLAQVAKVSYPAGRTSAFVHLFEWDWPSVASECEKWLAPHGFNAVQVSPPHEHIRGNTWWARYQPVSYELVSRSGNETELRDMVRRCSAVGVQVIFDIVLNHMANGEGVGTNGSSFSNRVFPAVGYKMNDFHHLSSDSSANCGISDWNNIDNVQRCDLDGLPDLCTGCNHTQEKIVTFLNNLKNIGNVGFRIDSAKCIDIKELSSIFHKAGQPWNFQEVYPLWGIADAVKPEMYLGNGLVTEFGLAHDSAPRFRGLGRKFAGVLDFSDLLPSDSAVTFVDNHDTQRNPTQYGLTYQDGDLYFLAVVFTLAVPYGYPKVLSSYSFSYYDQPPPSYPAMRCEGGWMCEHRRPEIANMIQWRRCAGMSLTADHVQEDDSGDHIAFSRGGSAFIALNRGQQAWQVTLQTGLPKGSYCNIVESIDLKTCSMIEVSEHGTADFYVKPRRAVAMHTKC